MLNLNGNVRSYNQKNTLIEKGLVAGNSKLVSETLLMLKANNYSLQNGDAKL